MQQIRARVAGRSVATDRWLEVRSPWDGSVVGRVAQCDTGHVDEACRAAAAALARQQGADADFPQHARAAVLDRAATLLEERVEEFARTMALEAGKPLRDARAEVARCLDTLRFSAAEARRLSGDVVPLAAGVGAASGRIGFALRVPVGVVAAITPFNFPLNLVAHKLGPAIAAGCPVVLKPADPTPLSALHFVDLLVEAGMPADWVSVLPGTGEDVGAPLVAHPIPRLVSFTGSVGVGRVIERAAVGKRVALELGSNAPVIVEPDADLPRVVAAIRKAGFSYAGQSCISTQRVLVAESRHAELLELLAEAVDSLVVGDPLEEATDVGPLINPTAAERVLRWVAEAERAGAKVVAGGVGVTAGGVTAGEPTAAAGPVCAVRPTVVDSPPLDCDVYRGEVFGPVVTVTPYRDLDEAFALANDSDFGLHAGIFTRDIGNALRAVRELDYGGVLVNEVPTWRADMQPYGGLRDSGNTREGPAYAIEEMTEVRFVMLSA
ncbi:MAG: aldehyde dehydrogenase family protein [Actinomycetales bacterium]